MMMSNVNYKQFLVHSLKLPDELCNEINGYLFHTKEESNVRNEFRMRICGKIGGKMGNSGIRRCGFSEDWVFFADYGEPYISAVNCRFCGNYLMSNGHITNHRILCFCDRELKEFEEMTKE